MEQIGIFFLVVKGVNTPVQSALLHHTHECLLVVELLCFNTMCHTRDDWNRFRVETVTLFEVVFSKVNLVRWNEALKLFAFLGLRHYLVKFIAYCSAQFSFLSSWTGESSFNLQKISRWSTLWCCVLLQGFVMLFKWAWAVQRAKIGCLSRVLKCHSLLFRRCVVWTGIWVAWPTGLHPHFQHLAASFNIATLAYQVVWVDINKLLVVK